MGYGEKEKIRTSLVQPHTHQRLKEGPKHKKQTNKTKEIKESIKKLNENSPSGYRRVVLRVFAEVARAWLRLRGLTGGWVPLGAGEALGTLKLAARRGRKPLAPKTALCKRVFSKSTGQAKFMLTQRSNH